MSELLTEIEAARFLACSRAFLRADRMKAVRDPEHDAVPFVKLGSRAIRYRLTDIEQWLDRRTAGAPR